MKYTLTKSFTREFPLVHAQMWGRRYLPEFLGEHVPDMPIYVFKFKNALLTAYRNIQVQNDTMNGIIKKKIDSDRNFLENLVDEKSLIRGELLKFINSKNITKKSFLKFLDNLFEYWQLHYIAQFVPLDKSRFSAGDRDIALKLRKTIDTDIVSCWNFITPALKKLYPELGELVVYLSWDEVKKPGIPTKAELEKRSLQVVILFNGQIVKGEELQRLEKKYHFRLDDDMAIRSGRTLKGQIACRGKALGRVRLIFKESDVPRFKEKEVLVSYMTMPTFMPALKIAAAFITDEGGITSHAAIIARELGKPCIIGTKVATRVLKDGDLVEVDANLGIINILEA